jgi:hypothetical protein
MKSAYVSKFVGSGDDENKSTFYSRNLNKDIKENDGIFQDFSIYRYFRRRRALYRSLTKEVQPTLYA